MRTILILFLSFYTPAIFGQEENVSGVDRNGFVIGFSVGGGISSVSDSYRDVPFEEVQGGFIFPNLKIGGMINDRTAILASIPGITYDLEGQDRSFDAIVPTVQYWLKNRWWINGGIGLAMDFPAIYEDKVEGDGWHFGGAVSLSTGIEVVQNKNFAMDINSNLLLGRVDLKDNVSDFRDAAIFTVGIGFTWY